MPLPSPSPTKNTKTQPRRADPQVRRAAVQVPRAAQKDAPRPCTTSSSTWSRRASPWRACRWGLALGVQIDVARAAPHLHAATCYWAGWLAGCLPGQQTRPSHRVVSLPPRLPPGACAPPTATPCVCRVCLC